MTRAPVRFDQASVVDAIPLILALVAWGLFKLGGRLMKVADDNLAIDFGDEETP